MDSTISSVLLGGFGCGCVVGLSLTGGLGTTGVEPSGRATHLLLLGAT